jgi:hypothetical protein
MGALCKYRDANGRSNEGIHRFRFLGVSSVDMGVTILGVLLAAYLLRVNFFMLFVVTMIVAICVHRSFCVNTAINKMIFGEV